MAAAKKNVDPNYGCFVNGIKQSVGKKDAMLKLARVLGKSKTSGRVTVYEMYRNQIDGTKQPIYKSENGRVKIG